MTLSFKHIILYIHSLQVYNMSRLPNLTLGLESVKELSEAEIRVNNSSPIFIPQEIRNMRSYFWWPFNDDLRARGKKKQIFRPYWDNLYDITLSNWDTLTWQIKRRCKEAKTDTPSRSLRLDLKPAITVSNWDTLSAITVSNWDTLSAITLSNWDILSVITLSNRDTLYNITLCNWDTL